MKSNELYHHGIRGMRWGIRRYQNKDGSLTARGKKRAAKLESDYEKLTGKKTKDSDDTETTTSVKGGGGKYSSGSAKKSVSEMSNDEIQEKIERIRLENTLASLQPKEVNKGREFTKGVFNDVIMPAAKNVGKQYLEKTLQKALGLNDDLTDPMKKLAKKAEKAGYEKKIAEAVAAERKNRKDAEADAEEAAAKAEKAAKKEAETKKKKASEGTVEGEGTSKRSTNDSFTKSPKDDIIDAEWREVGQDYVNQFLLEDKRNK